MKRLVYLLLIRATPAQMITSFAHLDRS